jgi:hypothetical protein
MLLISPEYIYELNAGNEGFVLVMGMNRYNRVSPVIKEGEIFVGSRVEFVREGEDKILVLSNEKGEVIASTKPIVTIFK